MELKDLLKRLQKQGFKVEKARNGHWKITAPNGQKRQIAATPGGDNRSVLNSISRLKKIGFDPRSV